jgi:phage gp45-like
MRTTLTDAARTASMSTARATIREVDDNHLMQEVKQADVYHSETPTDFERWQMVGMTSVPIKQQEDPGKKQSTQATQSNGNQGGDWNHDQPQGPAAEAVMLYLNGQRSHPVALIDDRRVRPYDMSEGEGAHYAPDGSEQMVLFKETGTYVVSLDGPSVKDKQTKKTRFVSLRHVSKKMQTHKIEKQQAQSSSGQQSSAPAPAALADGSPSGGGQQQGQQKYKHEGDTVNTEVRCTAGRIEFRSGDTVVGYYDKSADTWFLKGKVVQIEGDTTSITGNTRVETIGATYLGLDAKGGGGPQVVTVGGPAKKTFAEV